MTRSQFLGLTSALLLSGCTPKAPQGGGAPGRETLEVGFLPVTCHLTCPVTDFASHTTTTGTTFESRRFTDWPTVSDALRTGALKATFMIAPMAMKLREDGVPCKIVYLGHRDGSTVMVRKDDPAKSLSDLKGKTMAIPSKFSNQYLVLRKLMEDQGLKEDDLKFVEMPPPDMPTALAQKSIDSYFVGEPHAAKAQLDGTGRVLYHAKDIWPQFISCVLVVRDDLAKDKPEVVRDLVRGIAQSGEWAETHRDEAAKVAAPKFKQKEQIIKFVLNDPGRVSYRQLTPSDPEMQKIVDMAVKAKILKAPLPLTEFLDRSFIPEKIEAVKLDVK